MVALTYLQRRSRFEKCDDQNPRREDQRGLHRFRGKACEALDHRIRPEGLVVEEKELKPEHGFVTAGDQQQTVENNW